MDLKDLRKQIDQVDNELIRLFAQRMKISEQVAVYKRVHDLPTHVPERERQILQEVASKVPADMDNYARVLYSMLFELSRSYQRKQNPADTHLYQAIQTAIENTPKLFPNAPVIACQGAEGSYSQLACEKMFKTPNVMHFKNYESVFHAIDQGLCQYGVLPIESSAAGSVKTVYDLLIQHGFSIVRAFSMRADYCLVAPKGTELQNVKTIYSHQRAIGQCTDYLGSISGIQLVPMESTADAANFVARSGRSDVAAIASRSCASVYGLQILQPSVQNDSNNRTRFICFSKALEIYPGADKTSLMMVLNHTPGALYKVLARLFVLGINVLKLESRTIADNDFAVMFFFELETSVYSDEFMQLMCELDDLCVEFKYLGSFTEVV